MSQLIPSTTPLRLFKGHERPVCAAAVLPDRLRMVTASDDKTLRLWNLRTGVLLKKMEGHRAEVNELAVSRDGQIIASGDDKGEVIAWHGDTGEPLTQLIKADSGRIWALDFSPDCAVLATGSTDGTTKLWSTKTWQIQGNPIECGDYDNIFCIRYIPSGKLFAIATEGNIEIYNSDASKRVANFEGHTASNQSLAWTPDGMRLLSAGGDDDPTIREWDTSTWKQVGDPWTGHTRRISAIVIHPAGTHLASASRDNHVRLWQLSDRCTIAIFQHSASSLCATFSIDGTHIFSGGRDNMISEWELPKDAWPKEAPEMLASKAQESDSKARFHPSLVNVIRACFMQIFTITTTTQTACITGDLSSAEKILTQEIDADANNNTSYANRSLVMARQLEWDRALQDAIKSLSLRPSLSGYVAKGIALCGKQQLLDAMKAFDLAFTFTDGYSKTAHFLFLIKAIALFNANHSEEAILPIQELSARPNPDPLASRVVEAYLRVQLGTIAMDGALHKEAVDHFTAAVNAGAFFATLDIHSMYEDFVVLFGWDLKSLWQVANQQRYHALFRSGKFGTALEAYRYMMDMSDEATKAIFLAWINTLDEE
ncbi:WD40-repeat-containing domain protein [Suillus paluster]|uniref:WD40-repeat-containing domain protein n=1 Tax=Suillus paluster TaxID=48578 RepID=UPI001B85D834|nr:WD40-repeat-containing domain protein [Suillus paluster]KAG1731850.1 WD40-repeat-containing domain protein [Suillus paluster]